MFDLLGPGSKRLNIKVNSLNHRGTEEYDKQVAEAKAFNTAFYNELGLT